MGLLANIARAIGRTVARVLAPAPAPTPKRESAPRREPASRRQTTAAPKTSTREPAAPSRQRAAKTSTVATEPAVQPAQTRPAVSVPPAAEKPAEEAPARPAPMPAPSRVRDWLDQLEEAAARGAIVTLIVRFRRLVGKDQQPYRSTKVKQRQVKASTLGGSMQLFGNGASAERVLEQLGGDPYGKLEEWASDISQGEAAGVTSVDVFVVGELGGPWPKG